MLQFCGVINFGTKKFIENVPPDSVYISFLKYGTNSKWKKGKYIVYWPSYPQFNGIGNGHNTKIYDTSDCRCYLSALIYVMIKGIYNLKLKKVSIITDSDFLKYFIETKLDIYKNSEVLYYFKDEKMLSRNFDLIKIIYLTDSKNYNIPTMKILQYYNGNKLDKEEVIKRYENLIYGKRNVWYYLDENGKKSLEKKCFPKLNEPSFKTELENTTKHASMYYATGVFHSKYMNEYITKYVFQSFKDRVCVVETIKQKKLNLLPIKLHSIVKCLETAISLGRQEIILVHDIKFLSYALKNDWTNDQGEEISYKEHYYQILELLSNINVDFSYYDILTFPPSFSFFKTMSAAFYLNDYRKCEFG
ncbi:Hypothetical protein SRAE_2000472600 [Strongyloides ratti]|uniref:Ribonuclease H-like domain-containing protein n=1 Tax=Strongyloides ratti TaxID=34506 RepID=A0A090LR57_STRRB|nr:Hypothetical protein SRAE_2000472600 [Strongyloides ratti]CEF70086.1 Hypothetical protein SRAE_2000472600 [Strongyloides ratti]